MPRLLVVSATAAEAAFVPSSVEVVVTGMGKVKAAAATAAALAGRADRDDLLVVNLGTAGALRPGVSGLHVPGTVLNHDLSADALRMLGEDPDDELDVPGGDATVLASGDVFVTDPVVRDALAARAALVDMEGYAVAWACRRAGVPVRLVKHVSDQADESALDWTAQVEASARVLGEWVRSHA